MGGRRYFRGNPEVGHSGKSRQVPTLHPGTPPAKREGVTPNPTTRIQKKNHREI